MLRALLLQALHTIRTERQLMEQIDDNLLFRWFVGLASVDDRPRRAPAQESPGREARLGYLGHVLMEHRSGLIVNAMVTPADGHGERDAAVVMVEQLPRRHRITVAADKGYDTRDLVANLRAMHATPHVAQHTTHRRSAIDGRSVARLARRRSGPLHVAEENQTMPVTSSASCWNSAFSAISALKSSLCSPQLHRLCVLPSYNV